MRPHGSLILCLFALATSASAAEPNESVAAPSVDVGEGSSTDQAEVTDVPPRVDADTAQQFADALLDDDDPFNALTWYKLSEHLAPRPDGHTAFRIALCYERGERWAAAEQAWLDASEAAPDLGARSLYRAGVTSFHAGDPGLALLHLSEVRLEEGAGPWAARSAYVEAIVRLRQGELELADRELEEFLADYPDADLAPQALTARDLLSERVPRRSPVLAGVMSTVLPGSGQLYAGHAGDGLMAFLASAVLGGWSATLVGYGVESERDWALASGIGLGALALYNWVGNVNGAVRSARRTNTHLRRRHADDVLEAAAHPDLELDASDVDPP